MLQEKNVINTVWEKLGEEITQKGGTSFELFFKGKTENSKI